MPDLVHTLRLRDLLGLVIGAIIGSGIFLVPAGILNQVDHSVVAAALVWILGGVLSLLGALTYGELAAMKPEAGGLYVYIRDGFGPLPAFLYGWSLFLAIASGSISALAVAFSAYLGTVIPMSAVMGKIVAIVTIAAITAVNVWEPAKAPISRTGPRWSRQFWWWASAPRFCYWGVDTPPFPVRCGQLT